MEIIRLCSTFLLLVILSMTDAEVINRKLEMNGNMKFVSADRTNEFKGANVRRVRSQEPSREKNVLEHENKRNLSDEPHSRKKRLIWITDDGRLALPPGTVLSITPTLSLPLVRYPPDGFLSNITMSFPLTIDFDKLGLTDNENPLGVIPPVFARSMGRAAGSLLANYIGDYLRRRDKRSTDENYNNNHEYVAETKEAFTIPEQHRHAFHGGERAILYGVVEDLITTFGWNGKACLLRAICESHSKSLNNLGLLGEIMKLFFSASKSEYADLLVEYVEAERIGQGTHGPGECFPYYKECPRSFFKSPSHKYSESAAKEHTTTDTAPHSGGDDDKVDDTENVIELDGIEKDIVEKSANNLNGRFFKM